MWVNDTVVYPSQRGATVWGCVRWGGGGDGEMVLLVLPPSSQWELGPGCGDGA